MAQDGINEDLRTQPLLDSVRSLFDKERQLAGLQLGDKEWEAEQWRNKFLKLQEKTGGIGSTSELQDADRVKASARGSPLDDLDGDWDDIQAASKKTGDSYLRKLRRKESLDLSGRGISRQDLEGIVGKLRWLRGFTSVDLSGNSIDDACAQPLKNLMALRQVRRLDLSRNDLGPAASKALLDSLPRCKDLQVLRLEANVLFSRALDAGARLGSGLRAAIKAGGCRHLWDLSVTLDDFDGTFFKNAPSKKRKKEKAGSPAAAGSRHGITKAAEPLVLARQTPGDPMNALTFTRAFHPRASGGGLGALLSGGDGGESGGDGGRGGRGRGESNNKGCITSLGLPYARLHPRTVEELAAYAISSLTHLDLSFCYVGPAGAAALARALVDGEGNGGEGSATRGRGSRSVRSLKLPHNAIGDSGARAFSKALRSNRCLTFLSLASNGIGPVGGHALAAAVGRGANALARLDVGDNPLGGDASRNLVASATAGATGDSPAATGNGGSGHSRGTACGRATVRIQGLDRVAGATVATTIGAEAGTTTVAHGSSVLLAVYEEVSVPSGDDSRLDQVYQIILDTRFELPADQRSSSGAGETDRESTLDIQWNVTTSWLGACEWRVSRKREGEPEFSVKEGVGAGERLAVGRGKSDSDEPRDGYSLIRVQCNGWRKHDLLKIFVRPPRGGAGPVSCCDLTIGMVKSEPLPSTSMAYGLLWADSEGIDGDVRSKCRWPEEDRPRSPSAAECAEVAFQMSRKTAPCSATSEYSEARSTRITSGGDVRRLRHVQIGYGGRIRAAWQAMLTTFNLREHEQGPFWGRSTSGGRGGEDRLQPPGYSWAIARTRGVFRQDRGGPGNQTGRGVGDTCDPSCHVILQGSVPDLVTRPAGRSNYNIVHDADGCVEGAFSRENSGGGVHSAPPTTPIPATKSPWHWHSLGADTAGWLPGDMLSLWIQVDHSRRHSGRHPVLSLAAAEGQPVDGVGAAAPRAAARGQQQRRDDRSCVYARVRAFSLRIVDDARAEEIVRHAYRFPPRCHLTPSHAFIARSGKLEGNTDATETCGSTGGGGKAGGVDCYFPPAGSSSEPGSTTTPVVRLDFAAVSPMNLAAAGGSWA